MAMNPKKGFTKTQYQEAVNKVLQGDKELLSKLQDLPYLKEEYKLENMLKIQELEKTKATISQQTQTEFSTQDKSTQTDLTQEQIKTQEQENEQLKEQIKRLEEENN